MIAPVLVAGGAGYIGSHVALELIAAGRSVVVLDDLSTGRRDLVPPQAEFVQGDVGDSSLVRDLLARHGCASVMMFAGSIIVSESFQQPLPYWRNNIGAGFAFLDACAREGVRHLVYSSTAAVYGAPDSLPIPEDAALRPISPYGRSKLALEWALADLCSVSEMRFAALRYFNVAGADAQLRSGQVSPVATHLIKIATEVATGKRPGMAIYGDDYPTPDGTCIRDYIHVSDLAEAHVLALNHLEAGGESLIANCGYGRGFSVRDVLAAVERVAGKPLAVEIGPRRRGDPPALVADSSLLKQVLGWSPKRDDLDLMVRSALDWEGRNR
ncbi:UDP-glucose 4-epimerase GalE [Paramagnetospirillum marisnigri]|uniref:UDP-glucose 4-epimerase n=1 Tax=Paramagnetospirillum marisnigri TaxID=1285242 RepID=A0A178ML11_9PROT|nr:UDP-glucose 4-epimerase GalE [Paramagnetospirillum marisnigri]OAN49289.1 UDP-glucose 4-epimerase GalE [Paramagnetospirillum marisnigri]